YWSATAGWTAENPTALPGIGAAYRFEGKPLAFEGFGGRNHVYARTSTGDLIHYHGSAALGWAVEDVTTKLGVGADYEFEGKLAVLNVIARSHEVYGRNRNGHLIHYT